MSKAILIAGESGQGKTYSLRNLPPEETFYIDCDGKGLPWKGWRKQYNTENKNYFSTDYPEKVLTALQRIDSEQKQFKYVVVDALSSIMIADEMRRSKEKGYDKWQDLAQCVFGIVAKANRYRDDLVVILIAHTQTDMDDEGYKFTRLLTNGKKLNKIGLDKYLNTVLIAKCINPDEKNYIFETQAKNSIAKSPEGAFEATEIPNDIMAVIDALKEY